MLRLAPIVLTVLLLTGAERAEVPSSEITILSTAQDVQQNVVRGDDAWVVLFTDEEDTLLTQWFDIMTMHEFNIAMRWGVAPTATAPPPASNFPMILFAEAGSEGEPIPVRVTSELTMRKALEYIRDALIALNAQVARGRWQKAARARPLPVPQVERHDEL